MSQSPIPSPQSSDADQIAALEAEIARLEAELLEVEGEVNAFGAKIRSFIAPEIKRVNELQGIYKAQKAAKKAKRLEQKKRGKNYKEPKGLRKSTTNPQSSPFSKESGAQGDELKKLYREAIVHVHPDKLATEGAGLEEKATQLTSQLNELYDSGDLEGLRDFHLHILSGNALSHQPFQPGTAANPQILLEYLQKQRAELEALLKEAQSSHLYEVLHTYPRPLDFIGEMQEYFRERIQVFEKRTRKKG